MSDATQKTQLQCSALKIKYPAASDISGARHDVHLHCIVVIDNPYLLPTHEALLIFKMVVEGQELIKVGSCVSQHAGEQTIPAKTH